MASTIDQTINDCKLDKNHILEMENLLDIDNSTTENESSDEDSGTDTEDEFMPEMISKWDFNCKRLKSITNNNSNANKPKVERRPTRRPDPNTCNRNALMARENRKKKKEYVEKLEKSISQYLKQQKKLQKIIKKQAKFIQRLQNEKRYYKNILSNKSEILSLVNAVKQKSQLSSISNNIINNHNDTPQTSPTYSYSTNECYRSNSFSSQTDYPTSIFDDDLNDYNSTNLHDSWDNLLDWDCRMDEKVIQTEYNLQNISDEHNYVNLKNEHSNEINKNEDIGVCLHINKGKISLEFCPKCNLRSTTKLLSDSELYAIN